MPQLREALIALVLIAASTTPAHATTGPSITVERGRTQPVFSYADAVREHVYVESGVDSDSDGRTDRIRVDVIRPRESGPGLRVPAIIDESPYYDNSGRGNEGERKVYDSAGNIVKFPLFYDNYFVPRGYAVLNVDMIGTTRSDGCPDSGGRADVLGGKAVVDWLNGRAAARRADGGTAVADWATGRTAMIGKSYDGTLANAVAATGVEGLETIVPISAISSWYRYQRSNGVIYNYDYMSWLARHVDTDPAAKCAAVRARMDAEDGDDTGNHNAFWAARDHTAGPPGGPRVHAAVFAVHSVNDLNVRPDNFSRWWRLLASANVPRKVWIGQYQHVDPFDFEGRRDLWVGTLHRWFDHWLLGVENDVMQEPRADVQLGPGRWVTQADWPAPSALQVPLHPAADGSLGLTAAERGERAVFTDIRRPEEEMVADVGTAGPARAAFVTDPLPGDVRLSGTPLADLRIALDGPTANLTALVVDFGEDTRVDWRRGQGLTTLAGESCHGDSTALDDACYRKVATNLATRPLEIVARGWIDVQNRASLSTPSPLTPGTYGRVAWEALPHDYLFRKDHRLALVIAGTDATYSAEPATGARVTVDLAGSRVLLPLVPGPGGDTGLPKTAKKETKEGAKKGTGWHGPGRTPLPAPEHRFF